MSIHISANHNVTPSCAEINPTLHLDLCCRGCVANEQNNTIHDELGYTCARAEQIANTQTHTDTHTQTHTEANAACTSRQEVNHEVVEHL